MRPAEKNFGGAVQDLRSAITLVPVRFRLSVGLTHTILREAELWARERTNPEQIPATSLIR